MSKNLEKPNYKIADSLIDVLKTSRGKRKSYFSLRSFLSKKIKSGEFGEAKEIVEAIYKRADHSFEMEIEGKNANMKRTSSNKGGWFKNLVYAVKAALDKEGKDLGCWWVLFNEEFEFVCYNLEYVIKDTKRVCNNLSDAPKIFNEIFDSIPTYKYSTISDIILELHRIPSLPGIYAFKLEELGEHENDEISNAVRSLIIPQKSDSHNYLYIGRDKNNLRERLLEHILLISHRGWYLGTNLTMNMRKRLKLINASLFDLRDWILRHSSIQYALLYNPPDNCLEIIENEMINNLKPLFTKSK